MKPVTLGFYRCLISLDQERDDRKEYDYDY